VFVVENLLSRFYVRILTAWWRTFDVVEAKIHLEPILAIVGLGRFGSRQRILKVTLNRK
jgi:hypothetical protein